MPVYTTITELNYWLPDNLPATITMALKNTAIANAGNQIDSLLTKFALAYKSGTQKFPDVTDSPVTPANINEICQWLAAYRIYVILKEINKTEYKQGAALREMALDRLSAINANKEAIYLTDGTKIEPTDTGIYHTKKFFDPVIRSGLSAFDFIVPYQGAAVNTTPEVQVYSVAFVDETSIRVEHSLGYNPEVWITDSAGAVIYADVVHARDHTYFTVTFAETQSGTIYYR